MVRAMTKNESLGREDWVRVGTEALASGGLAAVNVEALARSLGVTKGSFYWHFANRAVLVAAILEGWEHRQTLSIIEQVERTGGDAGSRLAFLSRLAAAEPETDNAVEMALREEGRRDAGIATFVERVDQQRMNYLRGLFGDLGYPSLQAEARSLLCYALLLGDHFIAAGDGAMDRREVLRECQRLLFEPPA